MFENLPTAPPDSILGLSEAFDRDPRPTKINLTVGVFKDESGRTPILDSVKKAEQLLLTNEKTKSYLPIEGSKDFLQPVLKLVLGDQFDLGRVAAAHTPGGTGALRVGADTIGRQFPGSRIWLSNPTWANHASIFQAAGLETEVYSFLNAQKTGLDFDGMIESLQSKGRARDFVCLHACCHNPTGIDPSLDQWKVISELIASKRMIPYVDFAYQGFGDGLEEDRRPLEILLDKNPEAIVCASFSKNFGLYSERVGALLIINELGANTEAVLSQARMSIRCNYSNPPRHGEMIVATILNDESLSRQWRSEVAAMRTRISDMRVQFINGMHERGHDFAFLADQKGMFSYTGLNAMQTDWLKKDRGIYILGTGRVNVAGMSPKNLEPLCDAIAECLLPVA